jgi:hypothetical protein
MLESVVARRRAGVRRVRAAALRAALTLLFLVAPLLLRTAAACACGENPSCAAVWRADAVFVGTVVDRTPERVGGH